MQNGAFFDNCFSRGKERPVHQKSRLYVEAYTIYNLPNWTYFDCKNDLGNFKDNNPVQ